MLNNERSEMKKYRINNVQLYLDPTFDDPPFMSLDLNNGKRLNLEIDPTSLSMLAAVCDTIYKTAKALDPENN
jgi:hypothetical protein